LYRSPQIGLCRGFRDCRMEQQKGGDTAEEGGQPEDNLSTGRSGFASVASGCDTLSRYHSALSDAFSESVSPPVEQPGISFGGTSDGTLQSVNSLTGSDKIVADEIADHFQCDNGGLLRQSSILYRTVAKMEERSRGQRPGGGLEIPSDFPGDDEEFADLIGRSPSGIVRGVLERTHTLKLQVMVYDMLKEEVADLVKEKAEVAEKLRELERKEALLLEEVNKAEVLLGKELMDENLLEDPSFGAACDDPVYGDLVVQYRNLLDGYHAVKNSTTVQEVTAYVDGLSLAPEVPMLDVLQCNARWVKSHGWHLAGSHQGNSSQLYRLLAEEVGELLVELDRENKDRAAHETGDVFAYILQFIWEFKLQSSFPPDSKAPSKRWMRLDESFAAHQRRKAAELTNGASNNRIELRDVLLRLHRSVLSVASSLRTINGDHQRFQHVSGDAKRVVFAKDLDVMMERMIEVRLTVLGLCLSVGHS